MPVHHGDSAELGRVYDVATEIAKVYKGSVEIWPNSMAIPVIDLTFIPGNTGNFSDGSPSGRPRWFTNIEEVYVQRIQRRTNGYLIVLSRIVNGVGGSSIDVFPFVVNQSTIRIDYVHRGGFFPVEPTSDLPASFAGTLTSRVDRPFENRLGRPLQHTYEYYFTVTPNPSGLNLAYSRGRLQILL